ncbi:isocitrate lyase/phosphoenolpyruvate mutase family protein [Lysinibacter sp. HNR]|uniref:isocitrate lyase/PEP mutase family protein n=1 Tax=Lysinibacter sp. HNR TaxID=3031408 RepID=UPI0024355F24|nr:isocitrate lyase/phosphoenolpyruvate mutase family protein [Lysinibacter sp. HNR]WGD37168.1 isocitrate lyase/phosphoenolpyruvate mutase family protein [Lysinibacter sp. HNR]
MSTPEKAITLRKLYEDPRILRVVNVWDVISAQNISRLPDTHALATAGHSIASSHGYQDGQIPRDLMLSIVERIVQSTDLPVTADLDDGYGDVGETVRRAIDVGIVGANIEDRLRPLADAVANVSSAVAAGEAAGVDFVLNARTDAFPLGGDRPLDTIIADAIERGRAYLDAGATAIFVPGPVTPEIAERLVNGLGERKLSVIGLPGMPEAAAYEAIGVARISYGPFPQRVALRALNDLAAAIYAHGGVPEDTPALN